CRASAWLRSRVPALQTVDHSQPELRCASTVDHTVIERDRDRPDPPDHDLAVANDGTRRDSPDAEDRDLGVVDDRRVEEAAELAGARDREGRAAKLLGREAPSAGADGMPLEIVSELLVRPAVA